MDRDNATIAVLIAGAVMAAAAAGYFYLTEKGQQKPVQTVQTTGIHPLVKEQSVGVLYKLDEKTQDTLISAVEQFCVKNYERDSCIHHFSTCGNPCLAVIPHDRRGRIVEDYKSLRKARGLPDLKPMPKED